MTLAMLVVMIIGCRENTNERNCTCGNSCCEKQQTAEPSATTEAVVDAEPTTLVSYNNEKSGGDKLLHQQGGPRGQIITRRAYITSYNSTTKQPNWVAWCLKAEHTDGPLKFRRFNEDTSVAAPHATLDDYRDCGWSRGHMCPAGDNKWDTRAREETFLLTNICPQDGKLNGGTWNQIEMACREWAKDYGMVYIVCGPIFNSRNPKTIGKNRIAVPDAFFKVVAREDRGKYTTIAFICPNHGGTGKKAKYVTTVADVERTTGITFFPGVPSSAKNNADLDRW